MKNVKKVIFIIIAILIILLLCYLKYKNSSELENILIFNLYENTKENQYFFDITSGENKTETIDLLNTLKAKGNTQEKIAPGMKGEFEIVLKSSTKRNYQIQFNSYNAKPQNLLFNIKNDNNIVEKLEKLSKKLRGTLDKNKEEKINIEWIWKYEINNNSDKQDTADGMNIKDYRFNIDILCDN